MINAIVIYYLKQFLDTKIMAKIPSFSTCHVCTATIFYPKWQIVSTLSLYGLSFTYC